MLSLKHRLFTTHFHLNDISHYLAKIKKQKKIYKHVCERDAAGEGVIPFFVFFSFVSSNLVCDSRKQKKEEKYWKTAAVSQQEAISYFLNHQLL